MKRAAALLLLFALAACTRSNMDAQPKYHEGFEPMLPGFLYAPHGDLDATARLIDAVTCAVLLVWRPPGVPLVTALAAGLCGAVTVAVTVGISVPCHRRLARGWDPAAHARLVRSNWWRSAAWTLGGATALVMVLLQSAGLA